MGSEQVRSQESSLSSITAYVAEYGTGVELVLLGGSLVLLSFTYSPSLNAIVTAIGGWALLTLGGGLITGQATWDTWLSGTRIGVVFHAIAIPCFAIVAVLMVSQLAP